MFGRQQVHCADKRSEHPAAFDVRDQQNACAYLLRQAQVRDVPIAQIDLGDAARAFADNPVKPSCEAMIAFKHLCEEVVRVLVVVACGNRIPDFALHHDL